ncbi:MAG: hypothetical protein NTZ59_02685 [Bacteroidetes bacterium]|nr:hypothetical protein [Bacteroidota bacterium]
MRKIFHLIIIPTLFLVSCRRVVSIDKDNKGYGYVPIYVNKNDLKSINFSAPKPTVNAGKIYAYGNYIFQNDMGTGIHVIDNTQKLNPLKTGFLNIPYNFEMAIKDSFLYANNLIDLVVFDLHNPANPQLVNRINGVFPMQSIQNYPNESDVYFECVDSTKGAVIGWKKQITVSQNCYR